jgi:hypothetical protein
MLSIPGDDVFAQAASEIPQETAYKAEDTVPASCSTADWSSEDGYGSMYSLWFTQKEAVA